MHIRYCDLECYGAQIIPTIRELHSKRWLPGWRIATHDVTNTHVLPPNGLLVPALDIPQVVRDILNTSSTNAEACGARRCP